MFGGLPAGPAECAPDLQSAKALQEEELQEVWEGGWFGRFVGLGSFRGSSFFFVVVV